MSLKLSFIESESVNSLQLSHPNKTLTSTHRKHGRQDKRVYVLMATGPQLLLMWMILRIPDTSHLFNNQPSS